MTHPALHHKIRVRQACGPKFKKPHLKNSSDPLSEDDSSEDAEAPVKLSSSQATDYIVALKVYFLQQQGNCSAEVLQPTEMQHKVTAASLAGAKRALITQYGVK
ncbi:hypothetical protein HPB50_027401 [Hyalomma asiaticum]|uniref:Uncharacterized protein n=1 Tax=Hyalomma asiaticum TaxID=266040 RepID=A0ACB7RRF7_HYAAI|nr:hypothetical protein HPB50_027401 [Hyalomma asiaticum]